MFTYEFILWTKSLKHKVCSMCLWYNAMFSNLIFICFAAPLEVAPPGKIIAFLF